MNATYQRASAVGLTLLSVRPSATAATCQDQGSPRLGVDTVGGVAIVRNGRSRLWSPSERWTVQEEFRLRRADGRPEELFSGRLTSVSLGPHGQIFVLDFQSADIRVFNGRGGFVRRFAGSAHGPGELMNPSAMAQDAQQRLWISIAFNGRYSVFDSAGRFIRPILEGIGSVMTAA